MKTQTNQAGKDPRLVARVDIQTQQFIAQAAELSGMTMSQFLIDSARSKAEEVVDRKIGRASCRERVYIAV